MNGQFREKHKERYSFKYFRFLITLKFLQNYMVQIILDSPYFCSWTRIEIYKQKTPHVNPQVPYCSSARMASKESSYTENLCRTTFSIQFLKTHKKGKLQNLSSCFGISSWRRWFSCNWTWIIIICTSTIGYNFTWFLLPSTILILLNKHRFELSKHE